MLECVSVQASIIAKTYFHTRASISAKPPSAALINPTIAYDRANTPV
jgi:hypothetical protein